MKHTFIATIPLLLAAIHAQAQFLPLAADCFTLRTTDFCKEFVGVKVHPNFATFLSMTVYASKLANGTIVQGEVPFGQELPPPNLVTGQSGKGDGFDNAFAIAFHIHAVDMFTSLYGCAPELPGKNKTDSITPLFQNTFFCAVLAEFGSTWCGPTTSKRRQICSSTVTTFRNSVDTLVARDACKTKTSGNARLDSWLPKANTTTETNCIEGVKNDYQCSITDPTLACALSCPDPTLHCAFNSTTTNSTTKTGASTDQGAIGTTNADKSASTISNQLAEQSVPLWAGVVAAVIGVLILVVGGFLLRQRMARKSVIGKGDKDKGKLLQIHRSNTRLLNTAEESAHLTQSHHIPTKQSILEDSTSVTISVPLSPRRLSAEEQMLMVSPRMSQKNQSNILLDFDSIDNVPEVYLQFINTARRALAMFQPQLDDEMLIARGDIVITLEVYADGWASGTNHTTQHTGAFPLAIFCEVQESSDHRPLSTSSTTTPPNNKNGNSDDDRQLLNGVPSVSDRLGTQLTTTAPSFYDCEPVDGLSTVFPVGESLHGISTSRIENDLQSMSLSFLIEQATTGNRSASLRSMQHNTMASTTPTSQYRSTHNLDRQQSNVRRSKVLSISPDMTADLTFGSQLHP